MPSRKQRRRRQKGRRHEYEFVYVDEEGHEVEPDELPEPSRNGKAQRPKDKTKPKAGSRGRGPSRVVEPASWRKALRRGLIFAPLMFGVLYLLNRDLQLLGIVINTLILMAFFVPFGYLMDTIMYRAYVRRTGRG